MDLHLSGWRVQFTKTLFPLFTHREYPLLFQFFECDTEGFQSEPIRFLDVKIKILPNTQMFCQIDDDLRSRPGVVQRLDHLLLDADLRPLPAVLRIDRL